VRRKRIGGRRVIQRRQTGVIVWKARGE
jgi:hypothetical protein